MDKHYITNDNLIYILRLLKEKNEELFETKENHETDIEELREEMIILEEDDLTMDGLIDGEFPELSTEDKTILGAINELFEKLQQCGEGDEDYSEVLELIEQEIEKLREDIIILDEDDLTMDGLIDGTFPELTTKDKTILGAINELNAKSTSGEVLGLIEEEVNKIKEDMENLEQELRDEMIILEEDDLTMDGLIDNEFPELITEDKTLLGAINELKNDLNDRPMGDQALSEEINKIKEDIIDLENDFEDKMDALREEMNGIGGGSGEDCLTIDKLKVSAFSDLNTNNKTLVGAINELKIELEDTKAFDSIEEELNQIKDSIGSLEEGFDDKLLILDESIDDKLAILEGNVDDKLGVLEEAFDGKLETLENGLNEKIDAIDVLTMEEIAANEFDELTTEDKTILGAINELNEKVQDEQKLEVIEEEIGQLKDDLGALQEDLENSMTTLEENFDGKLDTLEGDLEGKLTVLEEELREELIILDEDDLTMEGLVDSTFPELTTDDKTILGAINELNEKTQNVQDQVTIVVEEEVNKIKDDMAALEEDLKNEADALEKSLKGEMDSLEKELKEEMIVLEDDNLTMEGLVDNEYPELTTDDKTILGSINELNQRLQVEEAKVDEIEQAVIDQLLMEVLGIKINEDGE